MALERPEVPASAPTKKRGCLFWVLVTVASLVVVGGAGGYLAYRYLGHRLIAAYTDTAPLDLGDPLSDPSALGRLDSRVAAFVHGMRNKRPVEPLELSGDDLTALFARSPELQESGGRARFEIADGQVRAEMSLPLERIGYPGHWFNGTAAFAVTLENGVLIVTTQSAAVRDQPLPGWLLGRLQQENLAKDLHKNGPAAAVVSQLETIEITDDKIKLVPRIRS